MFLLVLHIIVGIASVFHGCSWQSACGIAYHWCWSDGRSLRRLRWILRRDGMNSVNALQREDMKVYGVRWQKNMGDFCWQSVEQPGFRFIATASHLVRMLSSGC